MGGLRIGVGIGHQTPNGYMTHCLPDQRRKQPRRTPGADPDFLGADDLGSNPYDHRQQQKSPRSITAPQMPHGVVAGIVSGKSRCINGHRFPPPGTPLEQSQGRRQGGLQQFGGSFDDA
jgi:hypothetical protein